MKHAPTRPVAPNVEDPPCDRCGGDPATCSCYEEKHTPTPYSTEQLPLAAMPPQRKWCLYNKDAKGLVATCDREEDVLFLKRACNAHDALLQAARLVVVGGDQCFCHAGPTSWGRHRLDLGPGPCDWCVAKAAIALAEGKE